MTDPPPGADRGALLIATERARLRALVEVDMVTAEALHADDYELVTPGGATMTRAAYLGGIAEGSLNYRRFEAAAEERVRMLGRFGAAVRYRAAIELAWEGGEDSGTFWHTDIYELREGRWYAVWSQATRIREA